MLCLWLLRLVTKYFKIFSGWLEYKPVSGFLWTLMKKKFACQRNLKEKFWLGAKRGIEICLLSETNLQFFSGLHLVKFSFLPVLFYMKMKMGVYSYPRSWNVETSNFSNRVTKSNGRLWIREWERQKKRVQVYLWFPL